MLCELCRLPFRAGLVYAAQTFIYAARMSPALNGSSALQCFKCHNSIKLCKIFNFYPALPHVVYTVHDKVFTHTCNGVYSMYIQCRYTHCTCVAACTCMCTVHHNNRCGSLIVHVLFIGWIVSRFVSVKRWRRRKRRGRRRIRNRKC